MLSVDSGLSISPLQLIQLSRHVEIKQEPAPRSYPTLSGLSAWLAHAWGIDKYRGGQHGRP
jgi:hypothetical protein